ncbi:MAG: hypothetical protein FWE04_01325 [Oscillospiraceae bacterium]|nr:hypothetical protein [Oscillospiraceae bacterium]
MKKIWLVLLVLSIAINIVLVACLWQSRIVSQQIEDSETEEISLIDERHPLDISFEEIMSDPEVRGVANNRRDVSILYGDKWREEMERNLELMYSDLSVERWELVVQSQESWLVFEERDMELFSRAISQAWAGGNAIGEFIAFRRYQLYRNRALYLERIYEYLMTDWDWFEG